MSPVHPDLLHVKHLGTDVYLYGSVLRHLTAMVMPGGSTKNTRDVFTESQREYEAYLAIQGSWFDG